MAAEQQHVGRKALTDLVVTAAGRVRPLPGARRVVFCAGEAGQQAACDVPRIGVARDRNVLFAGVPVVGTVDDGGVPTAAARRVERHRVGNGSVLIEEQRSITERDHGSVVGAGSGIHRLEGTSEQHAVSARVGVDGEDTSACWARLPNGVERARTRSNLAVE